MKRMFSVIAKILKRERGFTLVEMVTVIAIMGVMAAVAVPMVNSQLSKSKEASYDQDQALIQTAVDSFVSAGDNVGYLGLAQFPILGARSGTTGLNLQTNFSRKTESLNTWVVTDPTPTGDVIVETVDLGLKTPLNPVRGTQGGEPRWIDGGDDNRNEEDNLNAELDTIDNAGSGWYVDRVIDPISGDPHAIDSRDYFIDFTALVAAGFLQSIPESASLDNGGGSSGSYSWYVKANGAVESLFFFFPESGLDFGEADPAIQQTDDLRGYFEGVYP